MPSIVNSTMALLVGFDSNVVFTNQSFGETFETDWWWLDDSGRTAGAITGGNTVAVLGGDLSPFQIGDFVQFVDTKNFSDVFQITGLGTNSLTFNNNLPASIQGDNINVSIDCTGASYSLLVREYQGTITNKNGSITIDAATFKLKASSAPLDFSTNVKVVNAAQGYIRILLPANSFTTDPSPDGTAANSPAIYCGRIAITFPAGTDPALEPAATKMQRLAWLVDSNLGE